jgi:hypothetical protein
MNMDVPVVVASGNYAPLRPIVVFASENYSLIVVGSVEGVGNKAADSQGGPLVTVHAVGVSATCLMNSGPVARSGTSLSAPLVAGEIANLLS